MSDRGFPSRIVKVELSPIGVESSISGRGHVVFKRRLTVKQHFGFCGQAVGNIDLREPGTAERSRELRWLSGQLALDTLLPPEVENWRAAHRLDRKGFCLMQKYAGNLLRQDGC